MKNFSQFNIQPATKGFDGDKIKMSKILNCEIVVHHFKIEDSKVFKERGSGKCLHLQISFNNEKHQRKNSPRSIPNNKKNKKNANRIHRQV